MLPQGSYRLGNRMDGDRLFSQIADAVHKKGNRGDMVKVGMRQEYMVDQTHLLKREVAHAGTGIDQHIVVQQKGGGPQCAADSSAAPKNSELHCLSPPT